MRPAEAIGLLPAAGWGRRLGRLPCSKEILPVALPRAEVTAAAPPVGVIVHLLDRMRLAGVRKAFVVIRDGKFDIPAYLGDGSAWGVHLAYVMMGLPHGTPYSLDQAYPFVKHARVLLGFPDVLFHPDDAFARILERQAVTGADVVLGLFPAAEPHKMDMVDVDAAGRVRSLVVKPADSDLRFAWIVAAWGPAFTEFLHDHVRNCPEPEPGTSGNLFVGEVIQAAIRADFHVDSVSFADGACLDLGTPEDLSRAAAGWFGDLSAEPSSAQ